MAKGLVNVSSGSSGSSTTYTTYLDDFATDPMVSRVAMRALGTWTHDSGAQKLKVVAGTGGNGAFAAQVGAPMCSIFGRLEVEATMNITTDTAARKHAGIFIETTGTGGTGYRIVGLDNSYVISKFTNGASEVAMATTAINAFTGFTQGTTYTIKVIIEFATGNGFLYIDGTLISCWRDQTYLQGRPGYFGYGSTVVWDNLSYKYS